MHTFKQASILGFLTCSVVAYISCLAVIFPFSWISALESIALSWTEKNGMLMFTAICFSLVLPDVIALCLFLRKQKQYPEMNHQLSAWWQSIIDLALVALILLFFYDLITKGDHSYQIQLSIAGLLVTSAIAFWFSQPFRFSKNLVSEKEAYCYLRGLISQPPYITFRVHAYHSETRFRTVSDTTTDSNGCSQTTYRTEAYQVSVTTLDRKLPYVISSWRDTTDIEVLLSPQHSKIAKTRITSSLEAADNSTQDHYNRSLSNFKSQYAGVDTHVDFSVYRGVKQMNRSLLLICKNIERKPFLLNAFVYFLASLTPFGWAYSLWLDTIAVVSEKTIFKKYSQF